MISLGFTRPLERLKESAEEARDMGFKVFAAPSMKIIEGDSSEFEKAKELLTSGKATIAIFGSMTSVEQCQREYGEDFGHLFKDVKIISIGPSTGKALKSAGLPADEMPEEYSSSGIVELMKDSVKGKTVLLMRSDSGSEVLYEGLTAAGADVISIATYKLEDIGMNTLLLHLITAIKGRYLDVMTFTSPKSVRIFYSHMNRQVGEEKTDELMADLKVAVIGNPTADALRSLGREPDIIPKDATFRDMLEEIDSTFSVTYTGPEE